MKLLNSELRIYSADISELTFGQIKALRNFSDDQPLGDILALHDGKEDNFIIPANHVERLYEFCKKGLSKPIEELEIKLPRFGENRDVVRLLIDVLKARGVKKKTEIVRSPDSKFINIGDDIFQISKLVAVKKCYEGEKAGIDIFVTNKRASIRRLFSSTVERDEEFMKVQRILEISA